MEYTKKHFELVKFILENKRLQSLVARYFEHETKAAQCEDQLLERLEHFNLGPISLDDFNSSLELYKSKFTELRTPEQDSSIRYLTNKEFESFVIDLLKNGTKIEMVSDLYRILVSNKIRMEENTVKAYFTKMSQSKIIKKDKIKNQWILLWE